MKKYRNTIEFEVYGDYALFSDPVTRVGGEKIKLPHSDLRGVKGDCGKHLLETEHYVDCGRRTYYEADSDGDERRASDCI